MSILVINEPTMSCCGAPRGKCTCGNKPQPTARKQSYVGQAVANLSGDTAPTEDEMLGIPAWNFDPESEVDSVANCGCEAVANAGAPQPHEMLGVPEWQF